MTSSELLAKAVSGASPATVVHLGGGDGSGAADWLAAGAARVVLVDPDPEAGRSAPLEGVERVGVAVAAEAGEAMLTRSNYPELSALVPPAPAMQALFPGLESLDRIEIRTLPLAEVLTPLKLDDGQSNVLIIETPGLEAVVVEALTAGSGDGTCLGDLFAHLVLRAAVEPLYQEAVGLEPLVSRLTEAGFVEVARDRSDPDLPVALLRHGLVGRTASRGAQRRVDARMAKLARQADALAAEKARLEAALQEAQNDGARLQDALDAARGEGDVLRGRLAAVEAGHAEKEARVQALEAEGRDLRERLARQEAALTQVTGERDDLRRQLTAHREDQEKAQDAVRDLTGKLKRQAEAMTTAQAQASLTTENLERERNLRQKLEKEFERLEGQLDLLRDFLLPRRGGE